MFSNCYKSDLSYNSVNDLVPRPTRDRFLSSTLMTA